MSVRNKHIDFLAGEMGRLLPGPRGGKSGEQQEQLDRLKSRLEASQVDARKVADVLPDSERLSMQAGGQLAAELKPFVADSVVKTIEKDPMPGRPVFGAIHGE